MSRLALAAAALAVLTGLGGTALPSPTEPPVGPRADRQRVGPVVVVAAGDISACAPPSCPAARTARRVRLIDPQLVLTTGDNQYPDGTLRQFRSQYDRTWGTFRGRTRPTPGNHDYGTVGARGYFDYFGPRAHPGHAGYYSFDVRGWHLVALNTNNRCAIVACGPKSAQVRWLRRDLAASTGSCLIGYWHHPRWSTGAHGNNREVATLWQVLARHDADIVLNGHDHGYERFARRGVDGNAAANGIRQFTVGVGGAELRRFTRPPTQLDRRRIAGRYGVLRLALAPQAYSWGFVAAGGNVLDRGGPTGC